MTTNGGAKAPPKIGRWDISPRAPGERMNRNMGSNDHGRNITYIYKCKNRECVYYKKTIESDKDPIAYIAQGGITKLCDKCSQPLILSRTIYDRSVFRGPKPDFDLKEPAEYLPEILRRNIINNERKPKP